MFYSPTLGLFNMSQMHDYSPIQVTTAHYWNYSSVPLMYPVNGMRDAVAKDDMTFLDVGPGGEATPSSARSRARLMANGWRYP
jgi:hypothetical protein